MSEYIPILRHFRWAIIRMICVAAIQPDSINHPAIRWFSFRFEYIQLAMSTRLVQFLCRAEFHARQNSKPSLISGEEFQT